jgi:hypothetical protein
MTRSLSFISRAVILVAFPALFSCTGHNGSLESPGRKEAENTQLSDNQAIITFDSLEHNFGTIIEGERVLCYFDYKNTGTSELVINSVEASCGCTTPDWSSEPLQPGERKSLQIIFDAAGRSGIQRKVVTVKSNASNSEVKITLKAMIET